MRRIRVAFVDFPGHANIDGILSLLRKRYEVVVDEVSPEYVFYSVFGSRFLKYSDAIRIFFTGENVFPDFNLCDYAFGFAWLSLEDRYFRCPNFCLYEEFRSMQHGQQTSGSHRDRVSPSRRFCNFIYSNKNAHPYRDALFHALNAYRRVDSAGPHLNNTGFCRGSRSLGADATRDKLAFQSEYKFSIAVENSTTIGYTTEKLVHAILAGTVPIYWGDPAVCRQFNALRMINCHDFDTIEDVVARVQEIDRDDRLYETLVQEPMFSRAEICDDLKEDRILEKLSYIIDQPLERCGRRNRHVWGRMYEEQRKFEVNAARPGGCTVGRASRKLRQLCRGIRRSFWTNAG